MKVFNKYFLLVVLGLLHQNSQAQFFTWAKQIKGDWMENLSTIKYYENGDFVVCGYIGANATFEDTTVATSFIGGTNNATVPYIAKYKINGRLDWVIAPTQVSGGYGNFNDFEILTNGDIIAVGQYVNSFAFGSHILPSSGGSGFVMKIDLQGNIAWLNDFNVDVVTPQLCKKITDSLIVITGEYQNSLSLGSFNVTDSGRNLFVSTIDSAGNWTFLTGSSTPIVNTNIFTYSLEANPQGDVYIGGLFFGGNFSFLGGNINLANFGVQESFLIKFNVLSGQFKWSKPFSCNCPLNTIDDMFLDSLTNKIYVIGHFNNSINIDGNILNSNGNMDMFLFEADSGSTINWVKGIGGGIFDYGVEIISTKPDHFSIFGEFSDSINVNGFNYSLGSSNTDAILNFKTDGTFTGFKSFDINSLSPNGLAYCEKTGGFMAAGYFSSTIFMNGWGFTSQGLNDILLYNIWTGVCNTDTKIIGNVYIDANNNCAFDIGEIPFKNALISCIPGSNYAITDSNGYYEMCVDTGNYTVIHIPINNNWNYTCTDSIPVTVSFLGQNTANFGYEAGLLCPKLKVDLSAGGVFRRCQNVNYIINATNVGTSVQPASYINFEMPPQVSYLNSNIPNTIQNGNNLTVPLGDLNPGQNISVLINCNVSCTAVVGSTACSSVKILPDTSCITPDSSYDRRNFTLKGECLLGDSVKFIVKNVNNINMLPYEGFTKIFLNNVYLRTDTFNLVSGDSMIITEDVQNATVRCELHFVLNQFPVYNGTQVTITDCDNSSGIGIGTINNLPQFDNDLNYEMICNNIIAAYDPNNKVASPEGITTLNYIAFGEVIEYQINFQNIGNDTAFNILVIDTLSPLLDISTFELGTSSHNFNFQITNSNVLSWYFPYINLPDSSTNFLESCGHINYKIRPFSGIPPLTQIFNDGNIYFDFNDPVKTNTVFHTLYDTTLIFSGINSPESATKFIMYPNPTKNIIYFKSIEPKFKNAILAIISNSYGQIKCKIQLEVKEVQQINLTNYSQGLYFINIYEDGKLIQSSKFVKL